MNRPPIDVAPWPPQDETDADNSPFSPSSSTEQVGLVTGWRLAVALPVHTYMPVGLHGLPDTFDYRLPLNLTNGDAEQNLVGCRVRVTMGRRELIGVVLHQSPLAQAGGLAADQLKLILEVIDTQPILPADIRTLLIWAAQYYHYPLGEVIAAALPALLRQGRPLDLLERYWRIVPEEIPVWTRRQSRQQQAYEALALYQQHGASEATLLLMGIDKATLKALETKQLIVSFQQPRQSRMEPITLAELPLTPSAGQQAAIEAIRKCLGRFEPVLLEGLTGSGKTEVYLQVMETVLAQGGQVLVLVPEIGLTPQTVNRFRARFKGHIVQLHSAMTDLARMQSWTAIAEGEAAILIGTRSAVFAPMPRLQLIVVDEEHDLSYKQQEGFRYHARDVALRRGQMAQCPVILGTATPSLESLHAARHGKRLHLQLTERAGEARQAALQVLDLRGKTRTNGLSQPLIQAIGDTLAEGNQVLVFLNRRGYAPVLLCESCGWQADCPRCDAHLTVHQIPLHLHCHHCDYQNRLPLACPACGSANLAPTGNGTARVEEALREQFADVPIRRVDRDTTGRKDAWESIYEQAHQDQPLILLGTQMLAKGHHFPYVTLVAVLDIDGSFLSADYRAAERAAQLLMQVAGRAGRAHRAGRVLIQTYQPDNPLLQTLIQQGYGNFALDLLQARQLAALPPYRHAMLLRAEAAEAAVTQHCLQYAVKQFRAQAGSHLTEIWGPVPAPMEKRAGVFRGHVLIFCQQRKLLHQLAGQWWRDLQKSPERRGVRLSLDIDPMELD